MSELRPFSTLSRTTARSAIGKGPWKLRDQIDNKLVIFPINALCSYRLGTVHGYAGAPALR